MIFTLTAFLHSEYWLAAIVRPTEAPVVGPDSDAVMADSAPKRLPITAEWRMRATPPARSRVDLIKSALFEGPRGPWIQSVTIGCCYETLALLSSRDRAGGRDNAACGRAGT